MGSPNRCKRCRRAIDLLKRQILCLDCQEELYEAEQRGLDRIELGRRPSPVGPVERIEAPRQPDQVVPRPTGPQAAELPPGMQLAATLEWWG